MPLMHLAMFAEIISMVSIGRRPCQPPRVIAVRISRNRAQWKRDGIWLRATRGKRGISTSD
jgi:hypothetical protein